jgi:hypothetical protein
MCCLTYLKTSRILFLRKHFSRSNEKSMIKFNYKWKQMGGLEVSVDRPQLHRAVPAGVDGVSHMADEPSRLHGRNAAAAVFRLYLAPQGGVLPHLINEAMRLPAAHLIYGHYAESWRQKEQRMAQSYLDMLIKMLSFMDKSIPENDNNE